MIKQLFRVESLPLETVLDTGDSGISYSRRLDKSTVSHCRIQVAQPSGSCYSLWNVGSWGSAMANSCLLPFPTPSTRRSGRHQALNPSNHGPWGAMSLLYVISRTAYHLFKTTSFTAMGSSVSVLKTSVGRRETRDLAHQKPPADPRFLLTPSNQENFLSSSSSILPHSSDDRNSQG